MPAGGGCDVCTAADWGWDDIVCRSVPRRVPIGRGFEIVGEVESGRSVDCWWGVG